MGSKSRVAVMVALVAMLAWLPPSGAQEPSNGSFDCPPQEICAWSEPFFTGSMTILHSPLGECVEESYRSFRNNSYNLQYQLGFWTIQDSGCRASGPPQTVSPGQEVPDVESIAHTIFRR